MIIYSKKNIHKWSRWQKRSKITFCLASGATYSLFMFTGLLLFKLIMGHTNNLWESLGSITLGAFIASTFMSIALWYENERRFKEWKSSKQ